MSDAWGQGGNSNINDMLREHLGIIRINADTLNDLEDNIPDQFGGFSRQSSLNQEP